MRGMCMEEKDPREWDFLSLFLNFNFLKLRAPSIIMLVYFYATAFSDSLLTPYMDVKDLSRSLRRYDFSPPVLLHRGWPPLLCIISNTPTSLFISLYEHPEPYHSHNSSTSGLTILDHHTLWWFPTFLLNLLNVLLPQPVGPQTVFFNFIKNTELFLPFILISHPVPDFIKWFSRTSFSSFVNEGSNTHLSNLAWRLKVNYVKHIALLFAKSRH